MPVPLGLFFLGRGSVRTIALPRLVPPLLVLTTLWCTPNEATPDEAKALVLRERMVKEQIEARGIQDPRLLAALRKVPRHLFVPGASLEESYMDTPVPIGNGQTISQPYIVAVMTEALALRGGEKVLEVGTGSGYQAAVLAEMGAKVYSIEILSPLAQQARERLARLGYQSVSVRTGDGYHGWPEAAPFDGIVVTAAAPRVPKALEEQLQDGGRLVLPVGEAFQELLLITRRGQIYTERRLFPVRFVPMTGDVSQ
jgi:protein-L-isoaspartate(D-aspartate) O-methyltransferase